jgi:hypothetical protein
MREVESKDTYHGNRKPDPGPWKPKNQIHPNEDDQVNEERITTIITSGFSGKLLKS